MPNVHHLSSLNMKRPLHAKQTPVGGATDRLSLELPRLDDYMRLLFSVSFALEGLSYSYLARRVMKLVRKQSQLGVALTSTDSRGALERHLSVEGKVVHYFFFLSRVAICQVVQFILGRMAFFHFSIWVSSKRTGKNLTNRIQF